MGTMVNAIFRVFTRGKIFLRIVESAPYGALLLLICLYPNFDSHAFQILVCEAIRFNPFRYVL